MTHRTTLLFDLDGTLTDPKEGITRCIAHALACMGHAPPPLEDLLFAIGPPLRPTFGRLLATDDRELIEAALAAYRERFATIGLYENALYANIRESLQAAHDNGHRLFLATSKPHVYANRILDHFGIAPLFSGVYGSELDGHHDDKGELIAHLISSEGLAAADCRMFGDRSHDVIGARKNGIDTIGVSWGYGSEAELRRAGAVAVCPAPDRLNEYFHSQTD